MNLFKQQDNQRTKALKQHQFHSEQSTRERRQKSLKLEISKYHEVESDSLLRWFVEVESAIEARCIDNERTQVAFSKSYLAGDARSWPRISSYTIQTFFGSLDIFKTLLSETFEPPRAEFRTLSEPPDIKQGKRKIHAYSQHVRYLASCMVVKSMSEFVKITIFKVLQMVPSEATCFAES